MPPLEKIDDMAQPDTKADATPIVIRRRRKSKHAVHHGGAWKVAYADFVTAMMAFFMLLWLLSNPDKTKLKGLAEYFSPATSNSSPTVLTSEPGPQPGLGGHSRRAQGDDKDPLGQPSAEAGAAGAARGGTADIPDAAMRVFADEMLVALEAQPDSQRNDAGGGARAARASEQPDGDRNLHERDLAFLVGQLDQRDRLQGRARDVPHRHVHAGRRSRRGRDELGRLGPYLQHHVLLPRPRDERRR